jgi:hypothetical protein
MDLGFRVYWGLVGESSNACIHVVAERAYWAEAERDYTRMCTSMWKEESDHQPGSGYGV